jgi:hypothetical protein
VVTEQAGATVAVMLSGLLGELADAANACGTSAAVIRYNTIELVRTGKVLPFTGNQNVTVTSIVSL